MVAAGPLVALVRSLADLVTGGIRQPSGEVLGNREPLRIREQGTFRLVGQRREFRIVGLLGGLAVEASPACDRWGCRGWRGSRSDRPCGGGRRYQNRWRSSCFLPHWAS
jgi:hypothetical protein